MHQIVLAPQTGSGADVERLACTHFHKHCFHQCNNMQQPLTCKHNSLSSVQISLNQPSCFPYAEVAVAVGQSHPGFAELMIARLHEVQPLALTLHVDKPSYVCQEGIMALLHEE